MRMTKFTLAAAACMAVAAIPSMASATINVTHDVTSLGGDSFTDTFGVSGIDKGSFSTTIDEVTKAAGTFDIQISLNESAQGITSLTALLNGQAITLTKQSGLNWFGSLSQTLATAGTQVISLTGTSNGNSKTLGGNITFAAATPEPAAWVLMIAGLGVVGGAMRRKRNNFVLA